jgi:aminotransferase
MLCDSLQETDLQPYRPAGAYYIMCECAELLRQYKLQNSLELAFHLVKTIGIATVPGSSFYSNPEYGQFIIRFCFCKNPDTLRKARTYLIKISRPARDR